jgi:uncharacterized protein (DUF58 family)
MIVTAEQLARNVLRAELRARKTAGGLVAGAYRTVFKGQGLEFLEVRDYVPGDDVRAIDWNVTARSGRPHVKRYAEDRDETVMLLLDVSASTRIAAARKSQSMIEVYAALACAAIRSNDQAGCILFSGQVDLYLPAARGEKQLLRLIREALAFDAPSSGTNVGAALNFLGKIRRKRALAFVISDFQTPDCGRELRVAARQHDLIAFSVFDPREAELPDCGLLDLDDAETGARWSIDTHHPGVRAAYAEAWRERSQSLGRLFDAAGVDHLDLAAGASHQAAITRFLHARALRT